MHPNRLAMLVGPCVLLGCNPHPLKRVEYSSEQEAGGTVEVSINKDVDILFVIDNSGSMSEEQATLARNFASFVEVLERDEVEANYRIAVTTTDVGHYGGTPGCMTPENGSFQLSSCRSRELEFGEMSDDPERPFARACLDVCDHDKIEVMPTSTHVEAEAKKRTWIESLGGVTNLPEGVTPTEAFSCIGPQGTDGCGFEAPLEAMYRALLDVQKQDSRSFGFIRPGAILAIVIVTDEVDCSARATPGNELVWDPSGPKSFWHANNRDNSYAQSDICWNAGVTCKAADDGTMDCSSHDFAPDGTDANDSDSVLFPVSRYTELIDTLQEDKRRVYEDQDVLVAVIGGVPQGYTSGEEELRYRLEAPAEQEFVDSHGVAPGCSKDGVGKAAPPVRLREFAEHYAGEDRNVFSVCNDDYSEALEAIADLIADQIKPACVETCVSDADAGLEGLQPACTVRERHLDVTTGAATEKAIEACIITDGGWEFPTDESVCYRSITGEALAQECAADGWNLELSIERKDDERAAPGTSITATCSASQNTTRDCPGLAG